MCLLQVILILIVIVTLILVSRSTNILENSSTRSNHHTTTQTEYTNLAVMTSGFSNGMGPASMWSFSCDSCLAVHDSAAG